VAAKLMVRQLAGTNASKAQCAPDEAITGAVCTDGTPSFEGGAFGGCTDQDGVEDSTRHTLFCAKLGN
jgi:hypothetical protein